MGDMDVRRLRADDWARWRDLRLELLMDAPEAFGSTYDETLTRPDESWQQYVAAAAESDTSAIFVVEEGERWLACAGGYVDRDEHGDIWLFSVWTRPARRGQGLQTRLVESVTAWARDLGHQTMKLWVTDTNDAARACYEKLGFTPTGMSQLMREGITELMLAKAI